MWNGTAATLKPRPAMIITSPTTTPGLMSEVAASTSLIPSKRVVPTSPYIWLIPYSKNAEERAPNSMYLVPPSFDFGL